MLVIHDEQVIRQLQKIADVEKRPVEAILKSLLQDYVTEDATKGDDANSDTVTSTTSAKDDALRQYLIKMYAKARRYWQTIGDSARLALTDADLDEQFWLFDADGIPRLKSDQDTVEIPDNDMSRLAKSAMSTTFRSGQPDLADRADEILDDELADDLLSHF